MAKETGVDETVWPSVTETVKLSLTAWPLASALVGVLELLRV